MTAFVAPETAINNGVCWKSNNEPVATVSNDGTVTAKKAGKVAITVTTIDGNFTATCKVAVIDPLPQTVSVTGVTLNATKIYREIGETFQLSATVTPSNATDKAVTWSTNDSSIATVTNGLVTFERWNVWDSTIITVTTNDGNHKATCEVVITQKPTATQVAGTDFVEISAGSMPLNSDGSYHVTLTKPFQICDHEVTQKEWFDVMGNNPSSFQGEEDDRKVAEGEMQENRPVENVTWYQAIAYCNERTKTENIKIVDTEEIDYVYFSDESLTTAYTTSDASGERVPHMKIDAKGYRLPTEAEWEIAARGGLTGDVYAGTDDVNQLGNYAWYRNNSDSKTHEVKKKTANGYGLYDMSGNVLEWCWDWYDNKDSISHYPGASSILYDNYGYIGETTDPYMSGVPSGYMIQRGGSCDFGEVSCSVFLRALFLGYSSIGPTMSWKSLHGFRLARSSIN